jgi:hypothetical protein
VTTKLYVLKFIFRWSVCNSIGGIHKNDILPNNDLLKLNSTTVTCLSNTKTTAENHFQVNFILRILLIYN